MKQQIEDLVRQARDSLAGIRGFNFPPETPIQIERTRDGKHGDFSSNYAMVVAKAVGEKPRDVAQMLTQQLPPSDILERVEIAGPGFINFFLRQGAYTRIIPEILQAGDRYGTSDTGARQRVMVEFVSANPTGPLHVGHGRGAAYGAALANLLEAAGYDVWREYYVNDAGRQMDILALSIWIRYLELCGQDVKFPEQAYRGGYVRDIAQVLHDDVQREICVEADTLYAGISGDPDGDEYLDAVIARARELLGTVNFARVLKLGLDRILADIRNDLQEFGVEFDCWYSERSLNEAGLVTRAMDRLRAADCLYEQDGATWFRSSRFGDEKDRVVIRENGQFTYFASDIAYHLDKFERGFSKAVDIWGADHHGHIARMKASLEALGNDPEALDVLLVQFATLYRGSERMQMSTRSGEFVTLRELRSEVGRDASRFFYTSRRSEQHLDFDLELAKSESNENPVYYIQYAHARICSVMAQLDEKGLEYAGAGAALDGARLVEPHESALMSTLSRYPDVVAEAARDYEPHQVGYFLRELANDFHSYYNSHQFLVDDDALRNARISLVLAVRQVIRNGLALIGVSAPEKM